MHELSVCQALIDQVEDVARQHHATRIMSIVVRVGPLAGIEDGLLLRAFSLAKAGTVAGDAELVVENSPVRVRCEQCGKETDVTPTCLVCGLCGAWRIQLISGDELLLASVELEKE